MWLPFSLNEGGHMARPYERKSWGRVLGDLRFEELQGDGQSTFLQRKPPL